MKKIILGSVFLSISLFLGVAQESIPTPIRLYEGQSIQSNGIGEPERFDGKSFLNVSNPEIFIFSPTEIIKNTGAAVLICPGGGYAREAIVHEGYQIAEWLASEGITGIVLKYRLPNMHKELPLMDVKEAMYWLRHHADSLHIDPNKIGIAGFSAGGHLAAMGGTAIEGRERPNFMILFYPVISMSDSLTHQGSKSHLLGNKPNQTDINTYSPDKLVNKQTVPTLLLLSDDDKTVDPLNSIAFYEALKKNKVKSSLYVFPVGGHGWGYNKDFKYHENWKSLTIQWLKDTGV